MYQYVYIYMFVLCFSVWSQDRCRVKTLLEVEGALKGRVLLEFKSHGEVGAGDRITQPNGGVYGSSIFISYEWDTTLEFAMRKPEGKVEKAYLW